MEDDERREIPCAGDWYGLFQKEEAIFPVPLCGWERVDGVWKGIFVPLGSAPPGFKLSGYVCGSHVANLQPDGTVMTWDELFREFTVNALRQQLHAQSKAEA